MIIISLCDVAISYHVIIISLCDVVISYHVIIIALLLLGYKHDPVMTNVAESS